MKKKDEQCLFKNFFFLISLEFFTFSRFFFLLLLKSFYSLLFDQGSKKEKSRKKPLNSPRTFFYVWKTDHQLKIDENFSFSLFNPSPKHAHTHSNGWYNHKKKLFGSIALCVCVFAVCAVTTLAFSLFVFVSQCIRIQRIIEMGELSCWNFNFVSHITNKYITYVLQPHYISYIYYIYACMYARCGLYDDVNVRIKQNKKNNNNNTGDNIHLQW